MNGEEIHIDSPIHPDDFFKTRNDPVDFFADEGFSDQKRGKTSGPCFAVEDQEILELRLSREAKIIESEEHGQKRIIVPIIIKKEVVAFVFAAEDKVRLTESQCKTLLLFLKDFIGRIVKSELEFMEHFHDKDLTHQQCIIKEAIEYIHNNYRDPCLTLKDVSSQKNISYHYLSHLFEKELKVTFSSYVTKVRLDMAASLLKNKNFSISQVAYNCGFEDPGYFSKTFKRCMGSSPVDYRSQCAPRQPKARTPHLTLSVIEVFLPLF